MYGWIWRGLPGPTAVRVLLALALVVGVVGLLFFVVFPVVDAHLPSSQVTVQH